MSTLEKGGLRYSLLPHIQQAEVPDCGAIPINFHEIRGKIGYPEAAFQQGIHGVVSLKIALNAEGQYADHKIINQPDPALVSAVEAYVHEMTFAQFFETNILPYPPKCWINREINVYFFHPQFDMPVMAANEGRYTVVGIVNSVDYQGSEPYIGVQLVTLSGKVVPVFWGGKGLRMDYASLKEGVVLGVAGRWTNFEGERLLGPTKIDILRK
ncbi:MAG: energy transducer TonB [Bacteroidia bacterium]|nr:energy transducer TonB [Bacteroidia bacterium]